MGQARNMVSADQVLEYWKSSAINLEVYKNQCFMCGYAGPLERAHIKPEHDGGKGTACNLHMLCKTCHTATESFSGDLYWKLFYQKYEHGYDFNINFHIAKYNAAIEYGKNNNIDCPLESFKQLIQSQQT